MVGLSIMKVFLTHPVYSLFANTILLVFLLGIWQMFVLLSVCVNAFKHVAQNNVADFQAKS